MSASYFEYSRKIHLAMILCVSLGLNFWGINWGLPTIYHWDEGLVHERVRNMVDERTLNPHYFAYGPLHFYELLAFSEIPSRIIRRAERALHLMNAEESDRSYAVWSMRLARALSAVLGTGIVALAYAYSLALFDSRSAALTAWLLAASMGLVVYSHFATVDIASMFWFSVSCLFSAFVLVSGERKWYLLSGFTIGLAAGVKYVGILAIVPLVCAHFLEKGRKRSSLLMGMGMGTAGLLVACPVIIFAPFEFLDGFTKEFFFNTGRMWDPSYAGWQYRYMGSHAFLQVLYFLKNLVGWPLFVAATCSILYSGVLARRQEYRSRIFLVWSCILPYYLVMGSQRFTLIWYSLPLIVFPAVLAGKMFADLSKSFYGQIINKVALSVVLSYSFLYTIATDAQFGNDARVAAWNWIIDHVPEGSKIEIEGLLLQEFPRSHHYLVTPGKGTSDMYDWIDLAIKNRDRDPIYKLARDSAFAAEEVAREVGLTSARAPYVAWYEVPYIQRILQANREAKTSEWSVEDLQRRGPNVLVVIGLEPEDLRWSREYAYYDMLFSGKTEYRIAQAFKFRVSRWLDAEIPLVNPRVTIFTKSPL